MNENRPKCQNCFSRLATSNGNGGYKRYCSGCHHKPHRRFKKEKCENCGFIPLHRCQLDVDHIDGNNSNNDPNNFRTLCANCHRLKTFLQKDYLKH